MALTLDLKGKPWWLGAIIGALLGAAVVAVCIYWFINPMQQEIAGLERNLQDLQAKVAEGQSAAAQLPKFQEEIAKLEKELQKLVQVLPSVDLPDVAFQRDTEPAEIQSQATALPAVVLAPLNPSSFFPARQQAFGHLHEQSSAKAEHESILILQHFLRC